MAKASALPAENTAPTGAFDLYMVGIPLDSYRALSDASAACGLTFAQGLATAMTDFIARVKAAQGELASTNEGPDV